MKDYNIMTVTELKQESRNRGLTLEYKGHKFNKKELIERLVEDDKSFSEQEEPEVKEVVKEETKQETKKENTYSIIRPQNMANHVTLDDIIAKYGGRKKQAKYDKDLVTGSFVVFVHYIEPLDTKGTILRKLRTAKVVAINRKRERVRVETILGTELELSFDDLLYIKPPTAGRNYPNDIYVFLHRQRTEKGKRLIHERLKQNDTAN